MVSTGLIFNVFDSKSCLEFEVLNGLFFSEVIKMASRSFAPLSSRQENTIGHGRADGLRAHKPGQRLVLGVLTENDQHNRVFGQVSVKGLHFLLQKRTKSDVGCVFFLKISSKYESALHAASARDVNTNSATLGDDVLESAERSTSFLMPSELLLVDDVIQDLGSGMLQDDSLEKCEYHDYETVCF